MLKTLEILGVTQPDAQVYILLGKKGPQKAVDISRSLRIPRQTIYRAIKTLQSKGIVTATLEHPSRFSAVPFERVLDLFVRSKTEEVQRIEGEKKSLINDWKSIAISEAGDQSPRFAVIEGRRQIYPRLKQMIEDTKSQLSIISTVPGLTRADRFGLLEAAYSHASKSSVKFRFLTELSEEDIHAMKTLLRGLPRDSGFEARTPESGLGLISRMLISDEAEVAFFVGQETERSEKDADDLCLWTNSKTIVNSFRAVFEDLWRNSIDIQTKIAEMETGKPMSKTHVFADAKKASEKYNEAISSAAKEVTIITSSQGLVDLAEKNQLLADWVRKRVNVRIMAPITRDSLNAVRQLSHCCQVKHVPVGYLGTTIVDEKDLFQFKNSPSGSEQQDARSFENAFYSNDSEYVQKTKKMLDDIWRNAQPPPASALESPTALHSKDLDILPENHPARKMVGMQVVDIRRLTEKQILSKIIHGKKFKVEEFERDPDRVYSSSGSAIIHPLESFGLPDLMIESVHIESSSSHGVGEVLTIYQPLSYEGKSGYAPTAVLMTNVEAYPGMKLVQAKGPAAQNVHLVKEDELEIRTHGNTMVVGWAVPIPLLPPKYVLPPGYVTIEGYGQVNPITYTMVTAVNRITIETNLFNAFVTFLHPRSKYSGPGTDGFFCRDTIITVRFLK